MDLPSAAPQMFQLPAPAQISQQPGLAQGLASGMNQGAALGMQAQQLAQERQKIEVEKHMKMMETGSQMMLEGGPEVQATGQQLIQKAYPFLTGQSLPPGMPLDKPHAKDLGWYMGQHRLWQETNGKEGLSAQDAATGAINAMSSYGKTYQAQQMGLLEKSPMYKEAMANQVGGMVDGQPATKNEYTGEVSTPSGGTMSPSAQGSFVDAGQAASLQNTNQNSIASNFNEVSKDQKEILDNGTQFLNMLAPKLPDNATPAQKAEFALHDKQAMLKYIQMQIPSSKRPPNMTMEDLVKSSSLPAEIKSAYNKTTQGSPLDNEIRDSLLKTGAQQIIDNEGILSQNEASFGNRAQFNRVDPMKALTNVRPGGIPSSSPFFKSQNMPGRLAQTGQIIKGTDGHYIFRGQAGTNDWKDPNNWMKIK